MPVRPMPRRWRGCSPCNGTRKALRPTSASRGRPTITMRSEEHTSELQSLMRISYAVFCLKKKKITENIQLTREHKIKPTTDEYNTHTSNNTTPINSRQ